MTLRIQTKGEVEYPNGHVETQTWPNKELGLVHDIQLYNFVP